MSEREPLSDAWWVQQARENGISARLDKLNATLEVLLTYQEELRLIYDAAPRDDIRALLERTNQRIENTAEHLDNTVKALEKHIGEGPPEEA